MILHYLYLFYVKPSCKNHNQDLAAILYKHIESKMAPIKLAYFVPGK